MYMKKLLISSLLIASSLSATELVETTASQSIEIKDAAKDYRETISNTIANVAGDKKNSETFIDRIYPTAKKLCVISFLITNTIGIKDYMLRSIYNMLHGR